MSADQEPAKEKGFIYILSNKSMPGLLKVGLTENSVRQRIRELSSATGVPTEYKLEKAFEIDASLLFRVEQTIHSELKSAGFHHNKEFFKLSITQCTTFAEDVILRVTGISSPELVGLGEQRQRAKALKEKWEADELARREKTVAEKNHQIAKMREDWLASQKEPTLQQAEKPWYEAISTFFGIMLGVPLMLFMLYAFGALFFELVGVVIGVVLVLAGGAWIYINEQTRENSHERSLSVKAAQLYPFKTLQDVPQRSYEDEIRRYEQEGRQSEEDKFRVRVRGYREQQRHKQEERQGGAAEEFAQQKEKPRSAASTRESVRDNRWFSAEFDQERFQQADRKRQETIRKWNQSLREHEQSQQEQPDKNILRALTIYKKRKACGQLVRSHAEWIYSRSTHCLFRIDLKVIFRSGEYWFDARGTIHGFMTNNKMYLFISNDLVEAVD